MADEVSWQPIKTAPKNGDEILLAHDGAADGTAGWVQIGYWEHGAWFVAEDEYDPRSKFAPTHWAPVPLPPGFRLVGGVPVAVRGPGQQPA